jgi:hypothetical protein
METSAKTGQNVKDLFSTVAKQLFLKLDPETVGNVRFLKDIK